MKERKGEVKLRQKVKEGGRERQHGAKSSLNLPVLVAHGTYAVFNNDRRFTTQLLLIG